MPAEFGSDIIVDLMRAYGIEYAAFNPGATFRGIHDSLVNYQPERGPRIIECAHEEISVAIAHGYAKAAGKPMVALVHNIVGLQHAAMAIYNAWVDRTPVMVMGGTGPRDITKRRPWIDWIHTALVQGNLVRDFVKYDDEPASLAGVPDAFLRAWRLATQEPAGPVYLNFDVAIQEERLTAPFAMPDVSLYPLPTRMAPDPQALAEVARHLVEAERPLIVADYSGTHPETVPQLVALAELVGAPVWDKEHRMSFPSTHPLDVGGGQDEYIRDADFILGLDVEDFFGTVNRYSRVTDQLQPLLAPGCKVAHISLRALGTRAWAHDFQRVTALDWDIMGDTRLAIPMLVEACRDRVAREGTRGAEAREARRSKIRSHHEAIREGAQAFARHYAQGTPGWIHPAVLSQTLQQAVSGQDWVLSFGRLAGWARKLMDWEKPNCYMGTEGGGGLGYGLGGTLGTRLGISDPNTLVIDIQADGDALFTPSALWTAAHHQIPALVIMNNNRTYYNSQHHALEIAEARARNVANQGIGTEINGPEVDFAALSRAYGCEGIGPISNPAELLPALEKAIEIVRNGKLCVVDVVTCPTDVGTSGGQA